MAFVDVSRIDPGGPVSVVCKYAVMGIFAVPAVIALLCGLFLSGFRSVKRDIGVVLVSGAGMAAMLALTMACMVMTPELKDFNRSGSISVFGDVAAGIGCILLFASLGAFLIVTSKRAA